MYERHTRTHRPSDASILQAAILGLTALAAASCAAPATTPSAGHSPSEELVTRAPTDPTLTPSFGFEVIPPESSASGVLELYEQPPAVFSSVVYVRAEGTLLLAGDTSGTISVLSLADPANPRLVSQIPLGTETYEEIVVTLDEWQIVRRTHAVEIRSAILHDHRLLVLTKSMLHVIDLRDPSAPLPMGSLSLGPRLNDMVASDDQVTVLVADTNNNELRLDAVDIGDPQAMRVVSQAVFPGTSAARARIAGQIVFVTARSMLTAPDLALYSLADPAHPIAIGTVPGIPAFRAWIESGLAYIATGQLIEVRGLGVFAEHASIQVADLREPSYPILLEEVAVPEIAVDLVIQGATAFVLVPNPHGIYELQVIDLQSPEKPESLRIVELWGEPQVACYAAGHVYIAAGSAGILVVDPEAGIVASDVTVKDLALP